VATGETPDLAALEADRTFDGGDLDCGSGLVLLIREHMLQVPEGGVLEMRSRETTVRSDLPPWCRMVGHDYLGCVEGQGFTRYFVRRGSARAAETEARALADDKERAKAYEWRLRARSAGPLHTRVYCRNFDWSVGQPASFEEHDERPSAVEQLLGALGGDLCTAFATACAQAGLDVDDVELTVRGRLENVLAHLGLEEGDPSFASIAVKCFASTLDDEERVREVWAQVTRRSPLLATLGKAVDVSVDLAIV
jgi:TusA-related sulfurtransferase